MVKLKDKDEYLVGVISDTHGLIRPGVPKTFSGVDLIVHAGDVGGKAVFKELQKIAPVVAVRGNMDGGKWGEQLPVTEVVEVGQTLLYMLHNIRQLDLNPESAGFQAVINGHTHQPKVEKKNGVLLLNPGSAGPRRFDYPVSVALLRIRQTELIPRIIEIEE